MLSQPLAWWQVITGVLTIPATLLGLVYTFRLYQKTKLEIEELKLKIVERKRSLGISDEPITSIEYAERHSGKALGHVYATISVVFPDLLVFVGLLLIPRPNLVPITTATQYAAALVTAILAIAFWKQLRSYRSMRHYTELTFAATFGIIISGFAIVTFLFTMAVWVIRVPSEPGRTISVVAGRQLTDKGQQLLRQPPYLTPEQALKAVQFRPEALWDARTLRGRIILITVSFNVGLLALFGALASLIELRRLRSGLGHGERHLTVRAAG